MNNKIEELYNVLDNKDKIINEQVLEIAKLKDDKKRAIKYIKELQNSCIVFSNIAYKELLEILGDKENENNR